MTPLFQSIALVVSLLAIINIAAYLVVGAIKKLLE
jgi:hypothetical protein